MLDNVHTGFLAGDDYQQAARLRAEEQAAREAESARVVELVTDAPPEVLGRVVLAVAALHEPASDGHCPQCTECTECTGCRPRRWPWWRRTTDAPDCPCPTWRVMAIELQSDTSGPRFTPA